MTSISTSMFRVDMVEDRKLDPMMCYQFVSSPKCGAINLFVGTIRDSDIKASAANKADHVLIEAIYYEAYKSMARKQIMTILSHHLIRFENGRLQLLDENVRACVALRLGRVPISEAAIIIGVSSTSRELAHSSTMKILNSIKASVVVWKKIIYTDGTEEWDDVTKSSAEWLDRQDRVKH